MRLMPIGIVFAPTLDGNRWAAEGFWAAFWADALDRPVIHATTTTQKKERKTFIKISNGVGRKEKMKGAGQFN
jgi:hypothetical protein